MEVTTIRSRPELDELKRGIGERIDYERLLSELVKGRDRWVLGAICQVCGRASRLDGDWLFSDGRVVNFRERLVCPGCELNNRQRFMATVVRRTLGERSGPTAVYLYEQVTPFFAWAERELDAEVVGSEYLGHDVEGGATIEGIRHEDALALSFDDATFDVLISNDVFEHVPDIDRSLAECARVLKPGGRMLFSIPFHAGSDGTARRAELRDGDVVELLPAQYHGNPISSGGSLVFYDHGWDVLDRCRAAGFADAYLLAYWSPLYGYLGDGVQLAFVADV